MRRVASAPAIRRGCLRCGVAQRAWAHRSSARTPDGPFACLDGDLHRWIDLDRCCTDAAMLDGRRDGSSIPRRARDRSPSRAPRSDIFRAAIDRSLASSERCLQARGGSTEGGRVAKPRVRAASRVTNVGRGRIDSPCGLFNEVCGARGSAGRREACLVLEYHQYSPSE